MTKTELLRRKLEQLDEYVTVDRSEVYSILQNNLDDIKKLKKMFTRFL